MKSLLNRIHRLSGPVASISRVHPARDEGINLLRKFVTEFIDIGGQVVIIGSWPGRGALPGVGPFQGAPEAFGPAGRAVRVGRPYRLPPDARSHAFHGAERPP